MKATTFGVGAEGSRGNPRRVCLGRSETAAINAIAEFAGSAGFVRRMGSETGNAHELAIAASAPGHVFRSIGDDHSRSKWIDETTGKKFELRLTAVEIES